MRKEGRDFNTLWEEEDSQSPWRVPDDQARDLVPRLRHEGLSTVLDLGFGLGRHVVLFAREGFETFGLEPTDSGFQHCTEWLKSEELNADIRQGNMLKLPFGDGQFDFVVSFNVIYHGTLSEMQTALREMHRVLRPKGLVFLTLNSTLNEWCGKGHEIERNTFINPDKGDGDHKHHYSDRHEVDQLLAGFEVETLQETEQTYAEKTYSGSWHWNILARKF